MILSFAIRHVQNKKAYVQWQKGVPFFRTKTFFFILLLSEKIYLLILKSREWAGNFLCYWDLTKSRITILEFLKEQIYVSPWWKIVQPSFKISRFLGVWKLKNQISEAKKPFLNRWEDLASEGSLFKKCGASYKKRWVDAPKPD